MGLFLWGFYTESMAESTIEIISINSKTGFQRPAFGKFII